MTEVPYDTAQALLRDLTGMPFGSERMHTVTNQVAEPLTVVDVAPSRQEIERRIAEVAAGRLRRPVLVLGMDGAYVPTRPDSARTPGEGRRGKRAARAVAGAMARREGVSLVSARRHGRCRLRFFLAILSLTFFFVNVRAVPSDRSCESLRQTYLGLPFHQTAG